MRRCCWRRPICWRNILLNPLCLFKYSADCCCRLVVCQYRKDMLYVDISNGYQYAVWSYYSTISDYHDAASSTSAVQKVCPWYARYTAQISAGCVEISGV
ncbi:hypothetical protein CEXT_201791 [Caerostris extrusa]|uniref:Uncharacterized protein n=1 Tax=Caerostris extrusa TaxID=172846 RepID=A0AAV4V326_CAEEX|nr:hypothetical protein CEXT_201791 [Caerostris extrusa]